MRRFLMNPNLALKVNKFNRKYLCVMIFIISSFK